MQQYFRNVPSREKLYDMLHNDDANMLFKLSVLLRRVFRNRSKKPMEVYNEIHVCKPVLHVLKLHCPGCALTCTVLLNT